MAATGRGGGYGAATAADDSDYCSGRLRAGCGGPRGFMPGPPPGRRRRRHRHRRNRAATRPFDSPPPPPLPQAVTLSSRQPSPDFESARCRHPDRGRMFGQNLIARTLRREGVASSSMNVLLNMTYTSMDVFLNTPSQAPQTAARAKKSGASSGCGRQCSSPSSSAECSTAAVSTTGGRPVAFTAQPPTSAAAELAAP
ncbi:Protein of unknown function [Gryllus bimaculatus]|nr:Protein of unknown function [Gryllus bimaculatus]